MVPPTGTQTEQGNLSQKRCDLKTVVFFWGVHTHIYIHTYISETVSGYPCHSQSSPKRSPLGMGSGPWLPCT